MGATKRPSYRVVAIDSRRPRDGRALEILGYYDPLTEPATVQIDAERFAAWVGKGALPSATVAKLIKLNGAGCRHQGRGAGRREAEGIPCPQAGRGGQGGGVKAFLEYVARSLVDDPEAVVVEVSEADDEVTLTLKVGEGDMGRIIGRDGRIANAIRSLLRVMGTRDGKHVELEIVGDD